MGEPRAVPAHWLSTLGPVYHPLKMGSCYNTNFMVTEKKLASSQLFVSSVRGWNLKKYNGLFSSDIYRCRSSWHVQVAWHHSIPDAYRYGTCMCPISWESYRVTSIIHGPLARYVKLWVGHAPGMPHHRGLAIPTCITARAWRTRRDACRDR